MTHNLTVRELVEDALKEAKILEVGLDNFNQDRMLLNAMRLSGAPYSFVEEIFKKTASR
jgi:hypothetical protein